MKENSDELNAIKTKPSALQNNTERMRRQATRGVSAKDTPETGPFPKRYEEF